MISNRLEDEDDYVNDNMTDSEEERKKKPVAPKKPKKVQAKILDETYADVYNSFSSAIENINSIVNSKSTTKAKKKVKGEQPVPSRPKMIHTQKTRVPVEGGKGTGNSV